MHESQSDEYKFNVVNEHQMMHMSEMFCITRLYFDRNLSPVDKVLRFFEWNFNNLLICQYTIIYALIVFSNKSKVFRRVDPHNLDMLLCAICLRLSNTNEWGKFQSKLDFKDCKTFTFLCDCSDLVIWKTRITERLKNPTPNQFFKTIDELIAYYEKSEIELLDNEYYIDRSNSIENILGFIQEKISG